MHLNMNVAITLEFVSSVTLYAFTTSNLDRGGSVGPRGTSPVSSFLMFTVELAYYVEYVNVTIWH